MATKEGLDDGVHLSYVSPILKKVAVFWAGSWMDIYKQEPTEVGAICLSWFLSFNYLVALVGLELSGPLAPAETKAMCHYVFNYGDTHTQIFLLAIPKCTVQQC